MPDFSWSNALWSVLVFLLILVVSILIYGAVNALISAFGGIVVVPITILVVIFVVGGFA